jgi:hypothetical protein
MPRERRQHAGRTAAGRTAASWNSAAERAWPGRRAGQPSDSPGQACRRDRRGAMLPEVRERDGTDTASRVHTNLTGASFTVRLPITGSAK